MPLRCTRAGEIAPIAQPDTEVRHGLQVAEAQVDCFLHAKVAPFGASFMQRTRRDEATIRPRLSKFAIFLQLNFDAVNDSKRGPWTRST